MNHGTSEIEILIREEKRLTSLESHAEAWAEGRSAGIEPEIIAEAAIATALGELMRGANEDVALALLEKMRERVTKGEFEPEVHLH